MHSMKAVFTLSVGILCLLSCHKMKTTPAGSLKLNFSGHYGPLVFHALEPYAYAGNQTIKFSKFDFYITGVQLIGSKETTNLNQHGLIDLTGNGSAFVLNDIAADNYHTLKLSIGVTPELNKKLPRDFPSNDPLSNTSHYWESWNSFIFSKMEGVLDTSGLKTFDLGFAVHTGTDSCLQFVTFQKPITIASNEETQVNLDVDVRRVFSQSSQFFDLIRSPLNHNPTNLETLKLFSTRLAGAMQITN